MRAHPLLAGAFAGLDAAAVPWCLLRGEEQVGDPAGDVDLLVDGSRLHDIDEVLAEHDFLPLPGLGNGGHRLYVGYHPDTDRWIELDVEWTVGFGPSSHFLVNWLRPALPTGAAPGLLQRRQRLGDVWVLDPDDAFWALLLHCIVDKRAVAAKHAPRLVDLAAEAVPDGALGGVVQELCPPGWSAARVLASAREGRWAELIELGAALPGRATAAHPIALRAAALGRGLRRLGAAAPRPGFTVALMGPDGAGKSTLAAGLATSAGVPARMVYMGLWQGETGDTGSLLGAAVAAVKRPVRSWRRSMVTFHHRYRGRLVVFDRHPYDALLPPGPPYAQLKRIFFRFLARSVPAPSLVLVLDLPAEVTARRRPEEDPSELDAARGEYLALAGRLPRVEVLDADQSPDELRTDAMARIWHAMVRGRSR